MWLSWDGGVDTPVADSVFICAISTILLFGIVAMGVTLWQESVEKAQNVVVFQDEEEKQFWERSHSECTYTYPAGAKEAYADKMVLERRKRSKQ